MLVGSMTSFLSLEFFGFSLEGNLDLANRCLGTSDEGKGEGMVAIGIRRVAPIVVGTLTLAILLAIGCGSPDATSKQTAKQASPQRSGRHATETARQYLKAGVAAQLLHKASSERIEGFH